MSVNIRNKHIFGNAVVSGDATVSSNAQVSGDARVYNNAWVSGDAQVSGNAQVSGKARVSGDATVSDNALVYGNARVSGDAVVSGDARVYGLMRSDGYCFTYLPCTDGEWRVIAGCRYFTMAEAREHWQKTRSGTALGNETMVILACLELLRAVKPKGV